MRKKILIILMSCLLALPLRISGVRADDDSDFAANESKYYSMCSSTGLSADQKATCKLFQQYLTNKAAGIQSTVKDIQSQISANKSDMDKVISAINAFQTQIDALQAQIDALQAQIDTMTANIAALQAQIDERTAKIDTLNEQIRDRMANIQSFVSLDKYIEFIMGATDFADLLRRTSAINEIMDYDTGQITLMQEEKKKLQSDQDELEEQRNSVTSQQAIMQETKKTMDDAKAEQEALLQTYYEKEAQLEAAKREQQNALSGLTDQLQSIANALGYVAPSPGWIYPISGSFYILAGAWYYPASFGGGVHLGVDFAASTSHYDVAVANGVIAFISDGYPSWGYLGDWVGKPSGGGNTVMLICQVGDRTYGVLYNHMSNGISSYVKVGDVVTQGTVLGHVGSSGNSTGAHTHIDLYDLGTRSLSEALTYMARTNLSFGAGWTLSGICGRKSTPCRLNPQSIFNVSVGRSYSS